MLFCAPHRRDRALLPHDPFKAVIAPRPIARCGYRGDHTVVHELFEMFRPD